MTDLIACDYQKLEKKIPDAAGVPVHLRPAPIFAHVPHLNVQMPEFMQKRRARQAAAQSAAEQSAPQASE